MGISPFYVRLYLRQIGLGSIPSWSTFSSESVLGIQDALKFPLVTILYGKKKLIPTTRTSIFQGFDAHFVLERAKRVRSLEIPTIYL